MKTVEQRFWDKVGDHSDPNVCWLWLASTIKSGKLQYGQINIEHKCVLAHRYAYELLIGTIPKGLTLDHLCRNTLCVNPKHSEPVTRRVNTLRGNGAPALNSRKTHCNQGHPFDKANTYTQKRRGKIIGRGCRMCAKAARS